MNTTPSPTDPGATPETTHPVTEYGTTRCPVEGVAAEIDADDRTCSACGAVVPAPETTLTDADGPECETCGSTTCPDADLPGFSEPKDCPFAPIYQALHDAKDCDYGCARDYTNQAIRLWVVPAVERIIEARTAALTAERDRYQQIAARRRAHAEQAEAALDRVKALAEEERLVSTSELRGALGVTE